MHLRADELPTFSIVGKKMSQSTVCCVTLFIASDIPANCVYSISTPYSR